MSDGKNPLFSSGKTTNSLLSAAATGFSLEDSAALLVPVTLQEQTSDISLLAAVTSEIDLNSDDPVDFEESSGDDNPPSVYPSVFSMVDSSSVESVPVIATNTGVAPISLFSNSASDNDPFSLLLSSSKPNSAPSQISTGMKESKSSDTLFGLGSFWSSGKAAVSTSAAPQPATVPLSSERPTVPPLATTGMYPKIPPGTTMQFSIEKQPGVEVQNFDMTSHGKTLEPGTVSTGLMHPSLSSPNLSSTNLTTDNAGQGFSTQFPMHQAHPPRGPPVGPPKGNNFRLGNQRPVYAQYPGLMGSSANPPPVPTISPMMADIPTTFVPSPEAQTNTWTQYGGPPASSVAANPSPMQTHTAPGIASPFTTNSGNAERVSPSLHNQRNSHNNYTHGHGTEHFSRPQSRSQALQTVYHPVSFHWFYRKDIDGRSVWKPFSMMDSTAVEAVYTSEKEEYVPTDGGRFDVDVKKRVKIPIYWEEAPTEVRRCSWFYKGPMDSRYVPYEEDLSERLENEYNQAMTTGVWHRRIEFPGGEAIVLHNPNAMSHFCKAAAPDEWGNIPESQLRPRVVKRGVEEFEIEEGESTQVDHLVFLVHGIGAICDFKFRSIVEAVDDFRHLSFQLMHSHFKESVDTKRAGRIEFLPVSWHKALHGDGGADQKLKPITLKSIPKLRNFTNDTLLDILFYTSPVYAQTIVDTVGNELNRLFNLFLTRNPSFNGYVALAGHSLGSLILFDLLAHQPQIGRSKTADSAEAVTSDDTVSWQTKNEASSLSMDAAVNSSLMVSYTIGSGTGQPFITYPTLEFEPTAFFALGSPIAMFVTVRGIDRLGEDFHFPTCPSFFNIFHPYDPFAYRLETLIDPNCDPRPILIPHHKGRKRFHLELKETMQRVGADIKQKFLDSLKTTWNTVYQYATFSKGENFEQEMERVIEGELVKTSEEVASNASGGDDADQDVGLGKLNGGRRIDYVLQEAPLESFNEYLFALSSHVCYWESEDTMLMIMKEIYASMGIFSDKKITPQSAVAPPTQYYQPTNIANSSVSSQPFFNPNSSSMGANGNINNYAFSATDSNVGTLIPSTVTDYTTASSASSAPPLFMSPNVSGSYQPWVTPPPALPISPREETGKPLYIGARPVVSPDVLPSLRGMDPTAPIASTASIGPPPLAGFQRKQ